MFNRRVFEETNFEKMDGLLFYLKKNNLEYCVSFERSDKDPKAHRSTVTWWA